MSSAGKPLARLALYASRLGLFAENVQGMVGVSHQLRALAYGQMVLQVDGEGLLVHGVNRVPHIVGEAIRGHKVQPGHREPGPEGVNILLAVQGEQVAGGGEGREGDRVQHMLLHQLVDVSPP